MITLTQAIIDDAIDRAKCCYADKVAENYARKAKGYGLCPKTTNNNDVLNMAIFCLEHYELTYTDTQNCMTADELYLNIENINNICGCPNC